MIRGSATVVLLLALGLVARGQGADVAVPSRLEELVGWLEDPDEGVRWEVAEVRRSAQYALHGLGFALEEEGVVLWWVVPRVYWVELSGLALLVVAWFALAARLTRRRPLSGLKRGAFFALTAVVPTLLVCSATGYALSRDWAQGFLPDPVLTVLPFPAAAALSAGSVCVLAAVWACWRRPAARGLDVPLEPSIGSTEGA